MQHNARVGSHDLGIVHLFALECSSPSVKIEQGNGRFCLSVGRSKISKGALRAVEAMTWIAGGGETHHERRPSRRCMAKLMLPVRCTAQAFFIYKKCGSSAVSS